MSNRLNAMGFLFIFLFSNGSIGLAEDSLQKNNGGPKKASSKTTESKNKANPKLDKRDTVPPNVKNYLKKLEEKEKALQKKRKYRKYGLELRGGMLFFPEFLLTGLFFDEAEGMFNGDFALGFVLRSSKSFEFVFGIGYHLFNYYDSEYPDGKPIPHVFLDKGDPAYEREFVKNTLSYLTIDVRFQKRFFVHERFQILVGGGVGLGILFGEIWRQDTYIPNYDSSKEASGGYSDDYKKWREDPIKNRRYLPNKPCSPPKANDPDAGYKQRFCENYEPWKEERVPPVIPTVDLVLGFVFPIIIDRWNIRLQGGMGLPRFFWFGLSSQIYF